VKHILGNCVALRVLSQLPGPEISWLNMPLKLSAFIAEQTFSNSFFLSILFLQICLFTLIAKFIQKCAQRGTKTNSPPPTDQIFESPPRSGHALYEHLILDKSPAYIQSTNFYYQARKSPSPPQETTVAVSQPVPYHQSEKQVPVSEANGTVKPIDASPLLEFSVNKSFAEDTEANRITFNAAYFACDKICDALFSKDVHGAMQLIKHYGSNPAVMSLVELKFKRASINCRWRLYSHTGVGELTLRNDKYILCFRSVTDEFVEAIVGKQTPNGARETELDLMPGLVQHASFAR
jgi:hypothetical protein